MDKIINKYVNVMDKDSNMNLITLLDLYYDNAITFDELKMPSKSEIETFINKLKKKIKDFIILDISNEDNNIAENINDFILENILIKKIVKNTNYFKSELFTNKTMKFIFILKGDGEVLNIGKSVYNLSSNSIYIFPDIWKLRYKVCSPKNDDMFFIIGDIIIK